MTLHECNWFAGWTLILSGFLTGAGLGLFFHQEKFLGGYTSFRRRIVRLGHIALVALGALNVLYSVSCPASGGASLCFIAGGISMPLVCFLTGWKAALRRLFPIPVALLVAAVVLVLCGGAQ